MAHFIPDLGPFMEAKPDRITVDELERLCVLEDELEHLHRLHDASLLSDMIVRAAYEIGEAELCRSGGPATREFFGRTLT